MYEKKTCRFRECYSFQNKMSFKIPVRVQHIYITVYLVVVVVAVVFIFCLIFFYLASKNAVVPLLLFVCLFICFTRYQKGLGGYFICVWVIGMSLGKSISALSIENLPVVIHTYDISMKTRPNGHIANKLYKVAENSSHKYRAAVLCDNHSEDMTFHVFPTDPYRRLVSLLSPFQSTFIYYNCSVNIFWG